MTELLNTLYVQSPGTYLRLDGDAVRVYLPEQEQQGSRKLIPLVRLDHIVLFGGTTATDELLLRCADDGRTVSWLTGAGRLRARLHGPTTGNPLLRQAQHRAADDPDHRLALARTMVAGKIHNTRQVLLRAARDTTGDRQAALRRVADQQVTLLTQLPDAGDVDTILGFEGAAAKQYFEVMPSLVSSARRNDWGPNGRTRRPPTDRVNCLLSFLYGMLRVAVVGALEHVGLDPYIGYLHGVRPGKPALGLDLMEEFRPLLADRLALTLINRKEVDVDDFETTPTGAVRLTDAGRRTVLTALQEHRQRPWPHATLQRDVPAALLPLVQARLLARHLRGDLDRYAPWTVN